MLQFKNDKHLYGNEKGIIEIEAKMIVCSYYGFNVESENLGPGWVEMNKFASKPSQETWKHATSGIDEMGYDDDGNPDGIFIPTVDVTPDDPSFPDTDTPWPSTDDGMCCGGSCDMCDPNPDPDPDPNPGDGGSTTPEPEVPPGLTDEEYKEVGLEAIVKIEQDINANATVWDGLLIGSGLFVNFQSINASAASCLQSARNSSTLLSYGRILGTAGVAIGTAQTVMAFTDDDEMTNVELWNAAATALGAISLGTSFCPALWHVSAITGIASGAIGIVTTVIGSRSAYSGAQLITVDLENGKKIHILIGA